MADQRLRALLLLLYAFWNNVHAQNPSDTGQYPFDWYKGDVTMECPSSDWLQLGTKCYLPVTNTAMRWDEAAMHCRRPQNGGGQLSILDNWILTRYLAKASDAAKEPYWLGFYINEMNSSSMVTPQYGQSKSIFNSLWAKTQPTMRPGRYCVMCNLDWENETMFGWAIDACDTSKPFLCETIACFEGEWRCNDSSKCINDKARCDGIQDCDDNSDEQKQNCPPNECVDGLRTSPSGEIFSPGFPNSYASNTNCEWRLQLGQGSRIALQFNVFDLEPLHDVLLIQDGESASLADEQRYSDTKTGEKWISKSNIVILKFTSDDKLERQGFHISYTLDTSIQNCDRIFEDFSGNFSPPGYYGSDFVTYAPDQRCNWIIRNPSPNGIVSIQFSRFVIAEGDILRLYDGLAVSNSTIGDFSSEVQPPTSISSSSPIMTVYFRSAENSRGAVGFVIHYQQSCEGQKISVESGSIESPGARTGIAPRSPFSCSWDLEAPQNTDGETQEFILYFDSLNLRDQDRITVSSGTSALNSIDPSSSTRRIRSKNGILTVSFKIAPERTVWGSFTASFSIDCPTLNGLSDLLKEPVYTFGNEYLSVVQFACQAGYVIQGVSSIMCVAGGKWSAEPPNCKRAYCLPVPTVDKGYLLSITGLQLDDRLTYGCEYGYRPLHTESICTSSKKWEPNPACQLIDCGTPKPYHEAIVMQLSNGTRLNSRALYKCSRMTAQTFGAPPYRFCQANGMWSEANFHCRETACFAYPLPHGRFDQISESVFGQTTVIADRGFQARPSSVVCNENLMWSEIPTIEDVNECLTPNRCSNGACQNLIGTYNCACQKGYVEQWTSPDSTQTAAINNKSISYTISPSVTTETAYSSTDSMPTTADSELTTFLSTQSTDTEPTTAVTAKFNDSTNSASIAATTAAPTQTTTTTTTTTAIKITQTTTPTPTSTRSTTTPTTTTSIPTRSTTTATTTTTTSTSTSTSTRSTTTPTTTTTTSTLLPIDTTTIPTVNHTAFTASFPTSATIDTTQASEITLSANGTTENTAGTSSTASSEQTETKTSMGLQSTTSVASSNGTTEANSIVPSSPISSTLSTLPEASFAPFTSDGVTTFSPTLPYLSNVTTEQTSTQATTASYSIGAFNLTNSTAYPTTATSVSEFMPTLTTEVVTAADTSAATVGVSSTTQHWLTIANTNVTQSTTASAITSPSQIDTTSTAIATTTTSQSYTSTTQTSTTSRMTTASSSSCYDYPTTSSVMEQTTVTTSLIKTCVDIDECAAGLTLCDYPDKCVNEEGGYRCDCPPEKWLFTPDRTALVSHKAFLAINQSCINQRCQAPPPSNDRMVRSPTHGLYLVNSTVLYYCTEGNIYESAYQPIAYTCQSSGQWSFVQFGQVPQPNCSKIPCDDPQQSFYNGRLTTDQQTFFAGDIVEYTCESNYLLVGPNRRVCFQYPFENRPRWVSHSAPKCIAISCPRIVAPMDGTMFVSQSEFIVGSTAWFACRPGFELIGSSVLSCQSDQTWSNTVPTCEAKKCAIDPPPSMEVAGALNALNRQRRQFNIDEQVSLRCLGEGFALSDAAPLKCMLPNSAASSQRDMSGGTSKYSSMMQVEYTTSATTSTPCKSALQAQAGHELRTTLSSLPNCSHIDLAVHDVGGSPDHTLQFIVALTGSGPTAPCMQLIKAHINKQMKEIHPDDEPLCSGAAKIVISLNVTNDIVSTNQGDSPLNQQYRRRQGCIEMISSNTLVLEGVTVDLWCVMSTNCDQKMFNIMWTKGSNELALRQTDDSRIEVVQTDTRIVDVRIAPVRPIDNDTYSCKIWDKARGDVVEKMVLKLEVVPNGKVNNPERINPESLQPNTTILYNSTNNAQRNSWQVYSASSEAGWIVLPDHHSALLRICSSNNQHADSWVRSPFIRVPNGVSDQVIRVRLSYVHQRCPNDGCAENIRVLWWQTNEMLAPWTVNDFEQIFELPFDETVASFELPAPISKIGLYFAFQGTGSCTTIFDLDVRSVACPRYAVDLSVFPNTPAPGAAAGSRFVDADCVDGAVAIPIASKLQCTVEGRWKNISAEGVPTVCICKPGYVRHGNMCEKQGPLCYECSNANSLLECASTPDRVRHCAVDDVCRTTVSHLANGQLVLDKGCAPANECTVSITNWSTCLRGEDDCTLCCNDDYCNFPPNAAAGNASAIPNFDRPVPNCRDVVPPTFYDCPKNITVSIGMKNFTLPTVVSWPKFKDNQHNVVITSTLADLTSDSYIFNQSVKEVNWTVTDQAGLKSVCSVPVIYKDSIAPIVKCPSDAIIVNVSSSTSPETPISFPAVAVLDASAIQSITYTPANGSLVPIDRPIEVIATAVDKFGNTGSCHFWFMATVSDCPHWMINKDEYSCLPTPVGRSIMCVSNKSCKNGRKMYPIDVDVISCSSNGQWHRLSRSNNQSFDNINDNPSLPLLPRCIDLAAPPVSFEVILNISGHIEKACLEPLINATKDKLGQLIRENCGNQFEYTVVFQSGESQWKPGLSRPVYQVTIPGTVETIVPDAQVHLAKVCISQFASRLSTMPPIFEPTECSTIQLVSQAGILKEGDTKCEPGWILVDSTEQLPSLCQKCPAGTFADRLTDQCAPCPKGSYSSVDGAVECTVCGSDRSTAREYSRSPADCLSECAPGYYSATGLAPCNSCAVGFFQQNTNQTGCESCPAGTTTATSATTNMENCKRPCVPGQYSDTGLEPCQPCPYHHFQPLSAQMHCIRCSFGMVTDRVGVRAPSDCLVSIPCTDDYCHNNGTCTTGTPLPQCDCPLGFAGADCSTPINLCFSAFCENGGTCHFDQLKSTCDCRPGFDGERCEKVTLCSENPCMNGGTCAAGPEHVECICPEPYSGQYCQDPRSDDPCAGISCTNGTCTTVEGGGSVCDCDPGFELRDGVCTLLGPCAFQPCVNTTSSTTCSDSIDNFDSSARFRCICDPNWTGEFCERTVRNCSTTECNNNGTCVMVSESGNLVPKCICPPRFTGPTCAESRVACDSSGTSLSCSGHGKCQNNGDHFICHCDIGYVGEFCSVRKNSCYDSPCLNGATCTDELEQPTCHCTHGWMGQICATQIDHCEPNNPCENGGTCFSVFGGYSCHCASSYTGTNCSIFIDPCCSTPCMDGATCTNVGGGYGGNYTCECTPGHTGHNCDQLIDICASNPCGANATCVPGESGSFNCACAPGYEYIDGRCILRDPCSGIAESICDHGGTCIPSGNTHSCKCLPGFTGSYCEQAIPCATNPCGANGTCVQILDSSQYNCTCDYGFSGVNCSQNEQLCSSTNNPCFNGGQCVENPGGFLSCNCLANYTGLHCESAKKLNFNLFFTGSPGMKQIVSYDFLGTLLQEFTLCSWIRYQSSSATSSQLPALQIPFITMASYGESISSDTPLLLIDGSSVNIGGTQRLNWTIDEHQWHHVCVRSPKASDKTYNWTLSVDGVIVGNKLLQQLPDQSGRKYQLLLGQSVDGTRLFSGQLSLVQLYYVYIEDSEIAEMYFECNKWLNESDSSKTIIDWNQFTTVDKYDSSVMALYPGICIQSSCLPGHVGCEIDKTPPEIVFCPMDRQVVSLTRLAVVTWDQPLFRDNVQVTEVKANYRSGQVFVWGEYQVIYIARDGAGNTAVCAFTVVVAPGNCSEINSPVNGAAAFVQPDGANGTLYARIKCFDDYGFSEVVRDFYTCDKMGRWDPLMTSELPYTFPACSKTSDPLQSLDGKVEMKDAPCEDKDDLTKKFVELINDANTKYNFFCGGPECNQQLKVTPYCGENPEGNFRRKRQASSNGVGITYSLTVNATRKAVQPYVNDTLQNSIFGRNGTIGTITTSWDCTHPLSEYMADTFNDVHQCVECPPGKFWNSSSQICQYCPLNSYQNQPNQTACIPCPNGKLTATTGTQGESDCFPKCNPGEKYSFAKGQCVVCDMGTYQPQPGSISCIPCPDGMSTPGNKSTNRTDCEYPCSPGQQLTVEDYCQDCDRGTYKVWRNQTACVSCPIGFTTLAVGAKLKSQCNVLNCPPGTYIKAGLNTPVNVENGYAMYCPLCAIGFYQEASNQTMCQACNQGDVTSALGSTGVKDCTPGKFNDCRPDLEGTCPTNQTCAQTDMGYQCTTVLGAEVKPVSGSWHVWVGITAGLVLFAILVAVVIVVFKIRVYQFIFCCKHPNLKDISTTQYYRNNTYPITHTSSADEAVSTVTSKTMVAGDIGVSIDSMSAADVYKEIYAGLQSTQSDETLFDYLAGGTGSPPGTASFDESPDDPGPSSPPPPILPPPRPSRERFEANSAGFYNPSFDSAGAQSPTWEQSDAFETPSVSSSWAKIEQLNRRGASDSVLFASGSITMRSNGFRRQTAARAFEPQPWPSSVQPPAAHSDDDDDDDYFG